MTPLLSIIVSSHNDAPQTVLTLASIRETSPPDVEVIVVDDCSATPLCHYIKPDEHTKLVTNRHRCGCGASRHIGALHATADWLLICDSHMRFAPGWFEEAMKCVAPFEDYGSAPFEIMAASEMVQQRMKTVFCATCLGLDSKHMDLNEPGPEYHGATFNLFGPDRNHPKNPPQVFECVWLPREPDYKDGDELPAIMGASYFISRNWFFELSALRFLSMWGGDEQALSLASWMAGGSVIMARSVRIGHKFLIEGREVQAYGTPPGVVVFNKLFLINAMLPTPMADRLTGLLLTNIDPREADAAKKLYRDQYFLVAQERTRYRKLFTRTFEWYCDRFQIAVP